MWKKPRSDSDLDGLSSFFSKCFFADELSSFNAITIYLNVSQVERMGELKKMKRFWAAKLAPGQRQRKKNGWKGIKIRLLYYGMGQCREKDWNFKEMLRVINLLSRFLLSINHKTWFFHFGNCHPLIEKNFTRYTKQFQASSFPLPDLPFLIMSEHVLGRQSHHHHLVTFICQLKKEIQDYEWKKICREKVEETHEKKSR